MSLMFFIPGFWYLYTSLYMFSMLDAACYLVLCVILLLSFEMVMPLKTSFVFQVPALSYPLSWSMPPLPWPLDIELEMPLETNFGFQVPTFSLNSIWSMPSLVWPFHPTLYIVLPAFWLFLLGYLIGWKLRSVRYRHKKKGQGQGVGARVVVSGGDTYHSVWFSAVAIILWIPSRIVIAMYH